MKDQIEVMFFLFPECTIARDSWVEPTHLSETINLPLKIGKVCVYSMLPDHICEINICEIMLGMLLLLLYYCLSLLSRACIRNNHLPLKVGVRYVYIIPFQTTSVRLRWVCCCCCCSTIAWDSWVKRLSETITLPLKVGVSYVTL